MSCALPQSHTQWLPAPPRLCHRHHKRELQRERERKPTTVASGRVEMRSRDDFLLLSRGRGHKSIWNPTPDKTERHYLRNVTMANICLLYSIKTTPAAISLFMGGRRRKTSNGRFFLRVSLSAFNFVVSLSLPSPFLPGLTIQTIKKAPLIDITNVLLASAQRRERVIVFPKWNRVENGNGMRVGVVDGRRGRHPDLVC